MAENIWNRLLGEALVRPNNNECGVETTIPLSPVVRHGQGVV